jgi:predicted DsbA family dithiol-disulfide isomerase
MCLTHILTIAQDQPADKTLCAVSNNGFRNGGRESAVGPNMKIEIWSDVACPWCYIGKRRFEAALAAFPHKEAVDVKWRSYQLDPTLPEHYDGTELDYLSSRKGMPRQQVSQMFDHVTQQAKGEGLDYRFDSVVVANSFTAHRLIHLAAAHGKQDEAKERLLSDHFEHGKDIGNRGYLTSLALDLGISADEVDELFTTDKYADDVRLDFEEGRALGISGVPFFVIDRKFGLSGAQPVETFTAALTQAWQDANPLVLVSSTDGEACGPDGCSVQP